MCNNLKQLERLEAWYEFETLTRLKDLCQLKHLEELELLKNDQDVEDEEEEQMEHFEDNLHQLMPKLKIYKIRQDEWRPVMIKNFEKLKQSALEECCVQLTTEEDM